MAPARLPLSVLLALGLVPVPALAADTGDTGDDTAVHPCLSVSEKEGCADDGAAGAFLLPGVLALAALGRRRRMSPAGEDRATLITSLSAEGVLPDDVVARLRGDADA